MTAQLKRLTALLLVSIFLTAFTTGCNTMEGAGEDLEEAGDKVEEATD